MQALDAGRLYCNLCINPGHKETDMKIVNPATSPVMTRRSLIGALAGASLLTALPAMAMGRLTDVRVVNRDSGEILRQIRYRGETWVVGEPGARYAIELYNPSRERLLHVVSVDGVNVVTGETAALDQAGYVLAPGQQYDVAGWRKSKREIAAFEFTRLPRSYAARTGRPQDVGVMGIAVFRERPEERRLEPHRPWQDRSAPFGKSAPGTPLGTGHGERERDRVGRTEFERRSPRPDEVIQIRYDSRANLVAMGILPQRPRRWREDPPSAFPGTNRGFVPDPF